MAYICMKWWGGGGGDLGQLLVFFLKGLVLGFNWDAGADQDISERGGALASLN